MKNTLRFIAYTIYVVIVSILAYFINDSVVSSLFKEKAVWWMTAFGMFVWAFLVLVVVSAASLCVLTFLKGSVRGFLSKLLTGLIVCSMAFLLYYVWSMPYLRYKGYGDIDTIFACIFGTLSVLATAIPLVLVFMEDKTNGKVYKGNYPRNKNGDIDYSKIADPDIHALALIEEFGEEAVSVVDRLRNELRDRFGSLAGIEDIYECKRKEKSINERAAYLDQMEKIVRCQLGLNKEKFKKEGAPSKPINPQDKILHVVEVSSDDKLQMAKAGVKKYPTSENQSGKLYQFSAISSDLRDHVRSTIDPINSIRYSGCFGIEIGDSVEFVLSRINHLDLTIDEMEEGVVISEWKLSSSIRICSNMFENIRFVTLLHDEKKLKGIFINIACEESDYLSMKMFLYKKMSMSLGNSTYEDINEVSWLKGNSEVSLRKIPTRDGEYSGIYISIK